MYNYITFGIVGYLAHKSTIAKIIFIYYLLYFSVYELAEFVNLTTDQWLVLNLFIDLITISLCYNAFRISTDLLCVCYGGWVIVGYIIPELLALNGLDAKPFESPLMCVIDVAFAIIGGVIRNENHCYNGDNKRDSGDSPGSDRGDWYTKAKR